MQYSLYLAVYFREGENPPTHLTLKSNTVETISTEQFSFWELKQLVSFVKEQPDGLNVKLYILNRATELGMTIVETIDDLLVSAIDLFIDRQNY